MAQNSKGAYLNVLQDADGKDVYPITRADGVYMNDGTTAQAKCEALDSKIDSAKSSLQSSFQAGVDGIYNAITAQGTTPASKSQGDVKNAIKTLADAKYAAGHKGSAVASDVLAGKTFSNDSSVNIGGSRVDLGSEPEMKGGTLYNGDVYLYPVSGGDGRDYGIRRGVHASPSNIAGWSGGTLFTRSQYDSNYSSGYNKGVTDADNRANSNSTNYKSGYNAGYNAAVSTVGMNALDAAGNNLVNNGNTAHIWFNAPRAGVYFCIINKWGGDRIAYTTTTGKNLVKADVIGNYDAAGCVVRVQVNAAGTFDIEFNSWNSNAVGRAYY